MVGRTIIWKDKHCSDLYLIGLRIGNKSTVTKICFPITAEALYHMGWYDIKEIVDNEEEPVEINIDLKITKGIK